MTRDEALDLVRRAVRPSDLRKPEATGQKRVPMTIRHPKRVDDSGVGFIDDSPPPRPQFLSPTLVRDSGPTLAGQDPHRNP